MDKNKIKNLFGPGAVMPAMSQVARQNHTATNTNIELGDGFFYFILFVVFIIALGIAIEIIFKYNGK